MFRAAVKRGLGGIRGLTAGPPTREPAVVGLAAGPQAREELSNLYEQTLRAVETLPSDAAYRMNVEKTTKYRLGVVQAYDHIETIEEKLGVGQIGEVIEQAQDELELIPHMAEWQPWKTAAGEQTPVKIELID